MATSRKEKTKVVLDNFTKALKRLKEAQKLNPTQINKDATIQRFEFCFELCWKLIQAFVRYQGMECVTPRNCIRIAAKLELVDNPSFWFGYLEARNMSSHLYDQKMANEVYKTSKKFSNDANLLVKKIRASLNDTSQPNNMTRSASS